MSKPRSFAAAWYAQQFLRELVLIYPVYAIMMDDTPGVSPFDLSLLFFGWSLTVLLLEVPSGTLADRLPRRSVLLAGTAIKAGCFVVWWLAPSFPGFLAGFVLWGVAGSLRSGCAESLLYDTLVEHGRERDFERVYGRGEAAAATAVSLAMALGGWLSEDGYGTVLWLSAAAPAAAAVIVFLFIREPPRSVRGGPDESYLGTMRAGVAEIGASRALRRPILYLCSVGLVYDVLEEYFGPLFSDHGFSLTGVGLVMAITNVARAGGFMAGAHLRAPSLRRGAAVYGFSALLLGAAAHTRGGLATGALAAFVALSSTGKILLEGRLQRAVEGHARATITSVVSLGREVVGLALYLVVGAIALRSNWSVSFAWIAGALAFGSVLLGVTEPARRPS